MTSNIARMGGGFTPRFAFEVVFLVLLAIACGLADLRPLVIGLVMGGAWVLMTGIEWLAWRAETTVDAPPVWTDVSGDGAEPLDSWDIDEILAPLPEVEGSTSVLPPAAEPRDEPPEPGQQ
jgi:hypothetical protein